MSFDERRVEAQLIANRKAKQRRRSVCDRRPVLIVVDRCHRDLRRNNLRAEWAVVLYVNG